MAESAAKIAFFSVKIASFSPKFASGIKRARVRWWLLTSCIEMVNGDITSIRFGYKIQRHRRVVQTIRATEC